MNISNAFNLDQPGVVYLKDKILDKSSDYYLQEDNYIINPAKTEYIPLPFISFETITPMFEEQEIYLNNRFPLAYYKSGDSFDYSHLVSNIGGTCTNIPIQVGDPTQCNVLASRGFVMVNGRLAFSLSVKVDYLRQIFLDTIDFIKNAPFFQLMDQHSLLNEPDIDDLITNKYKKAIAESFNENDLKEHCHIFRNSVLLEHLSGYTSRDYKSTWGSESSWESAGIRITDDDVEGYFESKNFTQIQLPTYSDIEEPDNITRETLTRWVSSDIEAEFPYVPA